jgi:hypothetical protein
MGHYILGPATGEMIPPAIGCSEGRFAAVDTDCAADTDLISFSDTSSVTGAPFTNTVVGVVTGVPVGLAAVGFVLNAEVSARLLVADAITPPNDSARDVETLRTRR